LAAAGLTGIVPDLQLDRLRWQAIPAGPVPLRIASPGGWTVDQDGAAEVLHAAVVERLLRPVVDAVGQVARLAPPLLWGNVASALGGAVDALGRARPDRADVTRTLAGRLLGRPPLAGTGEFVRPDPTRPRWFFVRRTCCLYYRIPGGGLCGDCVLVPAEDRARQWRAALDRDRPPLVGD
jgi:iron complex transport system ATP-binding protein